MNRSYQPTERLTDEQMRQMLEIAVEAAIEALNAFDGDSDLEPCGDDEPNTGDDEYSNGDDSGCELDYAEHDSNDSIVDHLDQSVAANIGDTQTHYA